MPVPAPATTTGIPTNASAPDGTDCHPAIVGPTPPVPATAPGPDGAAVSLLIAGMTCGACAARIERRLNALDGVEARVNYATERARVRLADRTTPAQRLLDEVEAAGYSATLLEDRAPGLGETDHAAGIDRRARALGRRLVVAGLLFMPLCDLSIAFWLVPTVRFPGWQWLLIGLAAPVVTWAAWPFHAAALRGLRHRATTMDTLVSLGIVVTTGWSLYAMFWRDTDHAARPMLFVITHQSGGAIYLDVAAGVTTFLLAGRYFEASAKRRTGNALRSLAAVGAKHVSVLDRASRADAPREADTAQGKRTERRVPVDQLAVGDRFVERRVPVDQLRVGDRFVVRPGETVAADGIVTSGGAAVDRSAMTGESVPADVTPGDRVIGGTVAIDGRLVVQATTVGRDTQLAQMVRLVEDAQNQKAAVQRLADRISAVFVPVVLLVAVVTLLGWLLAGGSAAQSCNAALSVLIIACPCALGLATPTALLVASDQGARRGIFFKSYGALEASRQIDTVVLDKTGTVTEGRMAVTDVATVAGVDRATLLRVAGPLEQASEHLVARAVAAAARRELGTLPPVDQFVSLPGQGARGVVKGRRTVIGKAELFADGPVAPEDLAARCAQWEALGKTVVLVGCDDAVIGAIAVTDTVRSSAAPAVAELHALGLRCVLLTGDNELAARAVGASIGVTDVRAGVLPAEKAALVRRLQEAGQCVAMVGDGVNDGPALAAADLGLAVGSGTDVAINAADLVIVRDDLRVVATAVRLSRRTLATIRGNLAWAFAYNLAAIPLAACGLLDPLVAGAAMALSSAFVVWNSSRLRHCLRRSPAMRTAPAVAPPTPAVVPAGSAPAAAPDPAPRAALRSR